ncbi:DUF1415 family protein, partial [Variovorax sp. CT11-76]
MSSGAFVAAEQAVADTRRWLERAVIGLNLCPFAKAVHVKSRIHYATYLPAEHDDLLDALLAEARQLVARAAPARAPTMLIAPRARWGVRGLNDLTA